MRQARAHTHTHTHLYQESVAAWHFVFPFPPFSFDLFASIHPFARACRLHRKVATACHHSLFPQLSRYPPDPSSYLTEQVHTSPFFSRRLASSAHTHAPLPYSLIIFSPLSFCKILFTGPPRCRSGTLGANSRWLSSPLPPGVFASWCRWRGCLWRICRHAHTW